MSGKQKITVTTPSDHFVCITTEDPRIIEGALRVVITGPPPRVVTFAPGSWLVTTAEEASDV